MSLDWLLLGDGSKLRGGVIPDGDLTALRRAVVAELLNVGAQRRQAEDLVPSGEALVAQLAKEYRELWQSGDFGWIRGPDGTRRYVRVLPAKLVAPDKNQTKRRRGKQQRRPPSLGPVLPVVRPAVWSDSWSSRRDRSH